MTHWQTKCPSHGDRAIFVLHLLQKTVREMCGQVVKPWANNVGNNIGFCTGPVPYLTVLGVIGAARGGKHRNTLVFGTGGAAKRLRQTPKEVARCRHKLASMAPMADALSVLPAPKTCKDWVRLFHAIIGITRDCRKAAKKTKHKAKGSQVVRSTMEGISSKTTSQIYCQSLVPSTFQILS